MRSGSSHLVRSLGKLFNHRVSSPRFGFAGKASTDDHQLDHMVTSVLHLEGDYVLHQHSKATGNNLHILKSFHYTPVVLQRKLYDCLVSVYDQMPASPHMTVPGVQRPEWNSMTDEQQWLWMAYNVVPWYLSYYASWHYADIEKHIVWYEDYYRDQIKGMRKLLEFLKVQDNVTDDMMDKVVNKKDNSFHVGKVGRGASVPMFVKSIVEESVRSWGSLGEKMKKELL
jgi:hypothetical protein